MSAAETSCGRGQTAFSLRSVQLCCVAASLRVRLALISDESVVAAVLYICITKQESNNDDHAVTNRRVSTLHTFESRRLMGERRGSCFTNRPDSCCKTKIMQLKPRTGDGMRFTCCFGVPETECTGLWTLLSRWKGGRASAAKVGPVLSCYKWQRHQGHVPQPTVTSTYLMFSAVWVHQLLPRRHHRAGFHARSESKLCCGRCSRRPQGVSVGVCFGEGWRRFVRPPIEQRVSV